MASSAHARTRPRKVPSPSAAALELGMRLHQAGDIHAAGEVYRTILDIDPGHGDALNLLGTAFAQQGLHAEGLRYIERALAHDPEEPTFLANHAEAHFQMGCAALRGGDNQRAIESFSAAVESNPTHRNALLNLGATHFRQGEWMPAEEAFRAILETDPSDREALHNLAHARSARGDGRGALQTLWGSVQAHPDDSLAWSDFAGVFRRVRFGPEHSLHALETIALAILDRDDIDHRGLGAQVARLLRRDPEIDLLLSLADTGSDSDLDSALFGSGGIDALDRPIVRRALERTILPDHSFELLFTRIRRLALETFLSGRSTVSSGFLTSLARQCHLNGYVWDFDANQVTQVEWLVHSIQGRGLGEEGDEARVSLIGCYVPLIEWDRAEEVVLLATEVQDPELAGLVLQQILEPFEESQRRGTIPSVAVTEDEVSTAVRAQYEEHPYPRWIAFDRSRAVTLEAAVRDVVGSGSLQPPPPAEPDILVAGCGTGRHLIDVATRFHSASVTGLDLSLSSLSYASRKLAEVDRDDVEVVQADILALGDWDRRFDLVDSSGVLHHMADPFRGWQVLTGLVRRHGFMRIGLYSAHARTGVTRLRNEIAELGFDGSPEGIRAARSELIARRSGGDADPTGWRDFYSMEECRDLLFHVQEHQMTIPWIADAIDRLGLEFVGFELSDSRTLGAFRAHAGATADPTSLEQWNAFEEEHPGTFGTMYQFWVRKR